MSEHVWPDQCVCEQGRQTKRILQIQHLGAHHPSGLAFRRKIQPWAGCPGIYKEALYCVSCESGNDSFWLKEYCAAHRVDKRLGHLGKQTWITQRTQIHRTLRTVRLPPLAEMLLPWEKKMKRLQKYRQEWGKESMWLEKVQDNACKAHCTVCQRTYSVAHGGLFDLKQRASSGGHIRNVRDNKTGGTLDWFVVHHVIPEAVFFLTP